MLGKLKTTLIKSIFFNLALVVREGSKEWFPYLFEVSASFHQFLKNRIEEKII